MWVNPLKATPGYVPLARGMAAALPYVDEFVEGHSLAALEELTACRMDDMRELLDDLDRWPRRQAGGRRPGRRHRGLRSA